MTVSDCREETGWKQGHYVSETAAFAVVTGVFIARNNRKWAWLERCQGNRRCLNSATSVFTGLKV